MIRNYNSPYSAIPFFPSGLNENIPAHLQMPQPGIYDLHLRQQKRQQMQQFARYAYNPAIASYQANAAKPNRMVSNYSIYHPSVSMNTPKYVNPYSYDASNRRNSYEANMLAQNNFNNSLEALRQHYQKPYVQAFQSLRQNNESTAKSKRQQEACAALRVNGCGPGGWINKLIGHIQNDFDFTQACNNHDTNFGTLGFGFERANSQFYQEMRSVPDIIDESGNRITSERTAGIYFAAVSSPMGKYYYNKAQENARICKYGE